MQADAVKRAIEDVTERDRADSESWPVRVYAPADHTASWKGDGKDPRSVFRTNIGEVFGPDALVVLAEHASAGVGQEIEWASTTGMPILCLTSSGQISRQIQGTPTFLDHRTYEENEQLEAAVKDFFRRWKPLILDGPRRRHARRLRFETLSTRLRDAWGDCGDRTTVAAQCRVMPDYLDVMLGDAGLTAAMPTHALLSLARERDVPVAPFLSERGQILPVQSLRALFAAAAKDGWSDSDVGLLMSHGMHCSSRMKEPSSRR
jgi:hypothetical protein